jgi:hypothetical protein
MKKKKRQRSIIGPVLLASLLAGGFGYCAGRRGAPKPANGPIVTMLECPDPSGGAPTTLAAATSTTKDDDASKRKGPVPSAKPLASRLPPLSNTADHREELLKYIREHSSELQECAAGQRERLRLTIRLDVGRQGAISRVQVVDDAPQIASVGLCLQQRMSNWKLPEQWVQPKQSLLMSVVL